MMRKFLVLILCLVIAKTGFGQINFNYLQTDSLRNELFRAKQDTSRVLLMSDLAEAYRLFNPDSSKYYGQKALQLAQELNFKKGIAGALISISVVQREQGNLATALDLATQALSVAQGHFISEEISALIRIANVYSASKDYDKALIFLDRAQSKSASIGNKTFVNVTQWLKAAVFEQENKLDSALYYADSAFKNLGWNVGAAYAYSILGDIQLKMKKDSLALHNYWFGLVDASRIKDSRTAANLKISLANYYKKHNQIDSAIYYAKEALFLAQQLSYKNRIISSSSILAEIYESRNPLEALYYYKIYNAAKDSLYGADKLQALQRLIMKDQENQKKTEAAHLAYQNRVKQYGLLGGLLSVLVILTLLYRNNRRKQKANELLEKQKKEIEEQRERAEVETSLEKVRTVAMSMRKPTDMLEVCKMISQQLASLGINEIRNVQTAIFYEQKGTYTNYEFYVKHAKALVTETEFKNHPVAEAFAEQMMKGANEFFTHSFSGNEVKDWLKYQKGTNVFIDNYLQTATSLNYYWYSMGPVALGLSTYAPLSKEQVGLFKRFRNVFELSYRRYLDIEKAEAQAREAKIETALERVRSRSIAMHKSEELKEVIRLVLEQLVHLNINAEHAGFYIDYKVHDDMHIWLADPNIEPFFAVIPYFNTPTWNSFLEAKAKGTSFYTDLLDFEEKNKFYQALFKLFTVPGEAKKFYLECKGLAVSTVLLDSIGLYIENFSGIPYTDEENKTLMRFGNVFQQTYTRFLDLQNAEAQAREAQIEAALERLRGRTMAMHQTSELQGVIHVVHHELLNLNLSIYGGSFVVINNDVESELRCWGSGGTANTSEEVQVPHFNMPFCTNLVTGIKKGPGFFTEEFSQQEKREYFTKLFEHKPWSDLSNEQKEETLLSSGGYTRSVAVSKYTSIFIINHNGRKFTETENDILKRFAKVFEQTYTRFLDLKKAEEQAREAQIQLALERVRAKTMAMQKSDELNDTSLMLYEQLENLGEPVDQFTIGIVNEMQGVMEVSATVRGSSLRQTFMHSIDEPIVMSRVYEGWKAGKKSFVLAIKGEELRAYNQYRNKLVGFEKFETDTKLLNRRIIYIAYFSKGMLALATNEPRPNESLQLLERFASAFDLTYTRFLDLKKAEEQAREAEIELALERVRARSMAMQKSSELTEVASLLFKQVNDLGIKTWTTGFNVWSEDNDSYTDYITNPEGKFIEPYTVDVNQFAVFTEMANAKKRGEKFLVHYSEGKVLAETYQQLAKSARKQYSKVQDPGFKFPDKQYEHIVFGSKVSLMFITYEPAPKAHDVFKRFGKVFEQTYTRFLDLQRAEEQAREAQVETALEKVRSRTLAMQKSDELAETAAVLFQQLITLGIEPRRLYIGIAESNLSDIEFWITDEDGSKVSTMFKGDAGKNISLKKMIDGWNRQEKSMVIDMQGKELEDYLQYLGEELHVPFKEGLSQSRRLQYLAFFSKGFIGMASPDEQPIESLQLLERFAYVFNLTFTRFNDLKIAEAHALQAEQDLIEIKQARRKAENALLELKATQQQLIQSEKMASLGELTAGIAHEIQNPLNFVNNFSEVSNELIDEIKAELDKGQIDEAKIIADDVKQNLEKITHHGKRADAIVKSMLQHSRKTAGQKDRVDINSLVDEYLRMSYHGARAKDKSFNAILETHFDPNIGKVNVIGQDISRVLLNLFNNAFYAVNEKKKTETDAYEPTIQVSTERVNGKVEIKVKDNGTGIPEKVLDKIYQPFFTTKPTGEGTGLGLSLSYDIITKGHGGEMKVETTEGKGSEFIIQLPILSSL